jgi:hypothetical protein
MEVPEEWRGTEIVISKDSEEISNFHPSQFRFI